MPNPDVFSALASRRSVRGFLPREVPREDLERIFTAAQRAPSWCNIQPWRVWVTSGATTERITRALLDATQRGAPQPDIAFPGDYPEPYGTHRRECGKALYQAMGIARNDTAARYDAWMRNFRAFGAPHVAIVGEDRRFGLYGALDVGCWLQSVMLCAQALGIATCPQASLASFPSVLRAELDIPADVAILCGIAIGYEDPDVPANACTTTRAPLADNVKLV